MKFPKPQPEPNPQQALAKAQADADHWGRIAAIRPVAGSGGVGVQHSEERPGGSRAAAEGRALGAKPGTGRSDDDVAGPSKSGSPDPLPATVFGPDDTGIVDKAGNIRLDTLNSRKIGQAFNAEQIQAARKLLLQSAIDVHERMQDAWPPGRGSTSVTTSQARCSAAPRQARNVSMQGHSFFGGSP